MYAVTVGTPLVKDIFNRVRSKSFGETNIMQPVFNLDEGRTEYENVEDPKAINCVRYMTDESTKRTAYNIIEGTLQHAASSGIALTQSPEMAEIMDRFIDEPSCQERCQCTNSFP